MPWPPVPVGPECCPCNPPGCADCTIVASFGSPGARFQCCPCFQLATPPCWSYDSTTFAWAGNCASWPAIVNAGGLFGLLIVNPIFYPPTASGSACQWRCKVAGSMIQADLLYNPLLDRWEWSMSTDNYATVIRYVLANASWSCSGPNIMTLNGNSTGCPAPATITVKSQQPIVGSPVPFCGDTLCDPYIPLGTTLHVTFQSSTCPNFNFSAPLLEQGGTPRSWCSAVLTLPDGVTTDTICLEEDDVFSNGCPTYILQDQTGIVSCAYINSPGIFFEDCPSRVCTPLLIKFPSIPINWDPDGSCFGTPGQCPTCFCNGHQLFASAIVTT